MSEQRYDIVDAADDACKGIYNFSSFALKAIYKVSNLEALKESFDAYSLSKFSQSVELFQYEHAKIDDEKRKEFYEDLKYNQQNLAYLYSMFEKSRTATFLIHMKILARLSALLIENKKLNYWESSLLVNINTLNDIDFKYLHKLLKSKQNSPLFTDDICEVSAITKSVQIGVLSQNDIVNLGGIEDKGRYSVNFKMNDFSEKLLELLDLIIDK